MDESRGLTHCISYWSRVEREEPTRLKEPIAMETKQLCLNCLPWPFLTTVVASSDEAAAQSFAPLSCQRRFRLPSRTQWTARLFLMLLLGKTLPAAAGAAAPARARVQQRHGRIAHITPSSWGRIITHLGSVPESRRCSVAAHPS